MKQVNAAFGLTIAAIRLKLSRVVDVFPPRLFRARDNVFAGPRWKSQMGLKSIIIRSLSPESPSDPPVFNPDDVEQ
jgi:hypothetical protein